MTLELEPYRFTAREARHVLRAYDLGHVAKVAEMRSGSPNSPKLIVSTDRGVYLVKRRAPAKSDPFKVAFSHEIQLHLAKHHFPIPHLLGTIEGNNTLLQLHGAVYEVFEFLSAGPYDGSVEATRSSGKTLALCHKLLADYHPAFTPPRGVFHNNPLVPKILHNVRQALEKLGRRDDPLFTLAHDVLHEYGEAARIATEAGLESWPVQIVHADFHPGNALYWEQHVIGVIDFDGARFQQRVMDLANSALGFSTFIDSSVPPGDWPVEVELPRFKAFLEGYDEVVLLSTGELAALPALMVEAVLNECTMLFANCSQPEEFERLEPWLRMGMLRGRWINRHAKELRTQLGC